MIDREVTINELSELSISLFAMGYPVSGMVCINAMTLLKEQEPVEPDIDLEGTCTCGNCGETVGYYPVGCNTPKKHGKFCPECGRRVKWDA